MEYSYTPRGRALGFLQALVALTVFACLLTLYRIAYTHSYALWYMVWNLFLAWIPLVFAWLLYVRTISGFLWTLQNSTLFVLWLLFVPNAFYVVTDFIHLRQYSGISVVYDIVLLATYSVAGLILGYVSLYLLHVRLTQAYGRRGHLLAILALALSGFAIYLGRYLRWNSWDILINPLRLMYDAVGSLLNPISLSYTLLFFGFLSVIYFVIWRAVALFRSTDK